MSDFLPIAMGEREQFWTIVLLIAGAIDASVGTWIGSQVRRVKAGFWLGLFFGPIGWIVTLLLPRLPESSPDARRKLGSGAPGAH